MSILLNGKELSKQIRTKIKEQTIALRAETGKTPGLATILVGNDPPSAKYVASKHRACLEAGFYSKAVNLPADTSQEELDHAITSLNLDPDIHGILLQMPIPKHLDSFKAIYAIKPCKDVDGFHPINVGKLSVGIEGLYPCTPEGIMEILRHYEIPIAGKRALVIGRSCLVGKPVARLLLRENATVTIAHSKTQNIQELVGQADILVAAIGQPAFIKGSWIKEGAVVIDVGITYVPDPESSSLYKLFGDVEFEEAKKRASYITPVPGGVGPMTVTMLLNNTLKAFKSIEKKKR
ncbi:MAG: bifunctional methylenetetrahydrofolate dehydrogenase/methenyltetrahydrofolate cyclohydrolase FolD [Candidatus Riflebacteria bacterium]|nr:bifunctional methylenetetrahydrofolate dehydrogenase/methenyltetrahydrofolate cyclohydrolase FolD [Candidatus Riflebacteria bacterium]